MIEKHTNVIMKFSMEGFHSWPEAREKLPEVGFLSDNHRHMFYVKAYKEVSHSDRDVEIILFKRKMMKYWEEKYGTPCEFGRQSCEDLAKELCIEFNLSACEVMEDNENGAVVQII